MLFWDQAKRFLTGLLLRQIIINPNYEVPETDYSNNILKCRCRYDGHRVWMYSCHNGTILWNTAEKHRPRNSTSLFSLVSQKSEKQ